MKPAGLNMNKKFYFYSGVLFFLILVSLFHRLDFQPLYQEEPRRALIALEMIYNGNYAVPTEFGELYYKKPPVWNWMIIAAYQIFGTNEFAVRFFSVLSFIIMGLLIFLASKKYINRRTAIFSSLFFLVSIDLYYYFSMLGEIDIFYSLITFGSFLSIFHFYEKKNYYLLFLLTYGLSAIGFLTKGFPSVVFLVLSVGTFFLYKRDLKKLFSLAHLSGILVFIVILGGYFLWYDQYNDALYYLNLLWSRSSNRTIAEESINNLLVHLFTFPLDLLKIMLPATLLLILMFRKGWIKMIRQNKLLEFSLIIFIVNILVYWISPGARERYVYMLLPFPILILSYFLDQSLDEKSNPKSRFVNILFASVLGLFPAIMVAINFIDDFDFIKGLWIISIIGFVLGFILIILYFKSNRAFRILVVVTGLILLRFMYNFVVLEHRHEKSDARLEKDIAYEMIEIVGEGPVYLYKSTVCSHNTVFYLEKELKKVVSRKDEFSDGGYFLANEYFHSEIEGMEIVYEFDDPRFKKLRLVRFSKQPD
jgi:4-amino-4-deoxy-L-arabinose transferase-like glycosyltransferase